MFSKNNKKAAPENKPAPVPAPPSIISRDLSIVGDLLSDGEIQIDGKVNGDIRTRILIVGGDEVSYGARPPEGQTWKQIFIDEVRGQISDADWARVHFLGRVPYDRFLRLLQLSRVHVYLTYPFVLSWSLMEAMSCGAAVVAGDTAPVREVVTHDATGRLVEFFDRDALVAEVCALLEDDGARRRLGRAAREMIRARYDLQTICLPRQVEWVGGLAGGA